MQGASRRGAAWWLRSVRRGGGVLLTLAALPALSAGQDAPAQASPATEGTQAPEKWGSYTDNLGFKVADTDRGDMSISIFSYVRYLNQKDLAQSYTNAFGDVLSVQRSHSVQLLKVQIKFLGWLFTQKLRYFLYAWTSNANQGQGAQVVLAGNLNYTFSTHLTLSGGITSLPGTRSVEGNFPYWFANDNRLIADEFFRPSYTSGIWVRGEIVPGLRYESMVGNNLSTLGVASTQLDSHLNTWSSALFWMPTTGEFGPGFTPGWGDFENHDRVSTRIGVHFTRGTEDKQSQPPSDEFENTQIRLSDGTIIFTPNVFGPGITVDELRFQMGTVDAGVKYRGFSLEGEYYVRWLNHFKGPGTEIIPPRYDRGFQLQISAMLMPKTLQVYAGGSRISGQYGNPWDFRLGTNWFPFKNQVVRWNTQIIRLFHSPVGYGALPYNVGSTGWVFNSDFVVAL